MDEYGDNKERKQVLGERKNENKKQKKIQKQGKFWIGSLHIAFFFYVLRVAFEKQAQAVQSSQRMSCRALAALTCEKSKGVGEEETSECK